MEPRFIDANKIKLTGISTFNDGEEILVPLSEVRKALQMTPTADVAPKSATAREIIEKVKKIIDEKYNRFVFKDQPYDADEEIEAIINYSDSISYEIYMLENEYLEAPHDQS